MSGPGPDAWFIFWRSKDGGPWEQIHQLAPRSIVRWNLGQISAGEIYEDDYGNRYRWERKAVDQ